MLLWLQRKAKVTQIWLQFLIAVFVVHSIVLLILFIRFAGSHVYHFSLNQSRIRSEAPIVFMPIEETDRQSQKSVVVQSKASIKKPDAKKAEPKKQAVPAKKAVVQKQEKKVPVVEKKPLAKAAASTKIQEKKAVDPVPQVKKEEVPSVLAVAPGQSVITAAHELEQLAMYEFISSAIGPRWKPPCCGDARTECRVKFSIGQDGKIATIEVIQSSGILLFDIAARNACAVSEQFPVWARLKEFCITMKV